MKLLSSIDIIKEIVDSIAPTIEIDSWTYDNTTKLFTVETCNTYYLRPCKTIKIGVFDYVVCENPIDAKEEADLLFIQDKKITLKDAGDGTLDQITETSFELYKPFFFHGSPIAVNNTLSDITFDTDKTPAVYLWETINEKHGNRLWTPIALEFQPRIFFLDSSEWEDWTPETHKSDVIDPMKALVKLFVDAIDKDRCKFQQLEDFTTVDRANFGMFQKELGVMSNYFNDSMSGVEFRAMIKYKKFNCDKSTC